MTEKPLEPNPDLEATIAAMDRCVDAVHVCGLAIGRTIGLDVYDVPRLCVSAGLRTLERHIGHYDKLLAADASGERHFDLTEKAKMRQAILACANDLQDVMAEALSTVNKIREALGVKPN